MTGIFLYGTLRFVPLLELVTDRDAGALDISPATLPGHAVHAAGDGSLAALTVCEGAAAEGLLLRGLAPEEAAALEYYAGACGFAAASRQVQTEGGGMLCAGIYLAEAGADGTAGGWDLDGWAVKWGAITLRAAREIMACRGRITVQQAAFALPPARRRASAWLAAQARPGDPAHDLTRDVVVHRHRQTHIGFYGFEEYDLQFRLNDGGMSPVLSRETFMNAEAAVVLPYDPLRDEVLLVEQFRPTVYMGGGTSPWMWEPVAGLIDPGESAEEAARRESLEEAGLLVEDLESVAETYPSSGSQTEFVHIFVGIADFSKRDGGGGVEEEGEDIRSDVLPFGLLMERIDARAYQDMPLVTAALWLARHRDRLRAKYA